MSGSEGWKPPSEGEDELGGQGFDKADGPSALRRPKARGAWRPKKERPRGPANRPERPQLEKLTCVRCLEERQKEDVDALFWCGSCRGKARGRALAWGWVVGAVFAAGLATWILAVVPSAYRAPLLWGITVVAGGWAASRLTRELLWAVMRWRNRKAIEAVPPMLPPPATS